MTQQKMHGLWRRTCGLVFSVRIPWVLYILVVILGMISAKVANLYIPYLTQMQTGRFSGNGFEAVGAYLGFSLLAALISVAEAIPGFYASGQVTMRMQNRLIGHSLRMHMSAFERNASQLLSWITNDCSFVDGLITAVIGFLTGIYSAYLSVTSMSAIDTSMLVIVPGIVIYVLFETWLEGKLLFLRQRRGRRADAELTAYLSEHLSFFTQIRQMNTIDEEIRLGKAADRQFFLATVYQAALTLAIGVFGGAVSNFITIMVFVMGAPMVRSGTMAITDLVNFQNYILLAYNSLSSFPGLYTNLMYYNGQLFYISSLMAEPEEDYNVSGSINGREDLTFEHVSFRYGEAPILRDVSFTVPHGGLTLLAGPNGSGKTTVFKLMERFYAPESGTIRFGNAPAAEINLQQWRQNFAYVLQDPQLFSGSIRDNITYGLDREASPEQVKAAARLANAHDFIMELPGGYDFNIGENGCRLSAGQRQRLAIARAIIVDPTWLLLDEATCNMDFASEREVTDALLNLMKGRTTVMISHNMDMIRRADHVIVLRDGTVEASGPPALVRRQSSTLRQLLEAGV